MNLSVYSPGRIRENVEIQSRPFHAYHGNEPYVFISYAHKSSHRVYPVIENLYLKGYNVWYDQGIPNFADLQDEIFRHIEGASYFIMFASTKSLKSPYVRLEIEHAFLCGKKMICVELKPVDISVADSGLQHMLKDCDFIEPDALLELLPDSVRGRESRDPDVFEVDKSGFEIKSFLDFEFHVENGKAVIDRYTGSQTEVSIPAVHDLFPIHRIGKGAFQDNTSVVRISLPEGLSEIGSGAFNGCIKLKNINIPQSVGTIGDAPFSGCLNLMHNGLLDDFKYYDDRDYPIIESVYYRCRGGLPADTAPVRRASHLPYPQQDRKYAFISADGDTAAEIFPYLNTLCDKGYNLILTENLREIENASLFIVFITQAAFEAASFCERIEMAIAGEIPLFPVALEKDIVYPEALYPYFDKKFILHRGDLTIDDFNYLVESELTQRGCRGKARDASYASDQMIHPVFDYIVGNAKVTLTRIRSEQAALPCIPDHIFSFPVTRIGKNFLKDAAIEEITLPEGIVEICENAFFGCEELRSVILPVGLQVIGKSAFAGCRKLQSISLPDSLQYIGDEAFSSCTSLFDITIPKRISLIGEGAFSFCEELTDVVLPDEMKQISARAFRGCRKLGSILIPKNVTKIGWSAFEECSQLRAISIPPRVRTIEKGAFSKCDMLSEIALPDAIAKIESNVFYRCSSLKSITLPAGLSEIGESAFTYCSQLVHIEIPNHVEHIASRAFEGCSSLISIVLPKGLSELSICIFMDCSSLCSVTLPEKLKIVGDGAFMRCLNLTSLTVPDSVIEIGENSFSGCNKMLILSGSKNSAVFNYAKRKRLKYKQG